MPRPRIFGFIAVFVALILSGLFVYSLAVIGGENFRYDEVDLNTLSNFTFYALAAPIGLVTMFVIGTGFWIGWTILTIKVVPPMPEIVEKKDFSKIKTFLLCLITVGLGALFIYGIYVRNFWALA